MSLTLVGILGIAVLMLLLFVFGMPVGFAMALVGFGGFSYIINLNAGVNMVSQELWSVFSKYGLTVIPLFVFMGRLPFIPGSMNAFTRPRISGSAISGAVLPWPPSWPVPLLPPSAGPIRPRPLP